MLEGVRMTKDALAGVLASEGVEEIEADGGPFDPHVHEALLAQPAEGVEPGHVIQVIQRGYRMGDVVLRPGAGGGRRSELSGTPRDPVRRARRREDRDRRRDQEGVPQARPRAAPGPQPGRRVRRGAVQGRAGRVRHPLRPREAPGVRPLRRGGGGRGRASARAASASRTSTSATCPTCSAGSARSSAAASVPRDRGPSAAPTSSRASGSRSRTRSRASRSAFRSRSRRRVTSAAAAAPSPAPRRARAPTARGAACISDSQGLFALSHPCQRCRGNGVIVDTPCTTCRGAGRERVTRRYQVKVPAGAKDGTRIRLKGKGEPGRNGGPGRRPLRPRPGRRRRRSTSAAAPTSCSTCR